MIQFDHVSFAYGDAAPVLDNVNLSVEEGHFALVTGRTGTGKSTLLGLVNGHVPHFTGGHMAGHVRVAGQDTRQLMPRDLAEIVGVVAQDPMAGFVTDTVEEELAYGMEQLGVKPATMRQRVEDVLDLLSIEPLRTKALRSLSGGQQQRVAIASVLAAGARLLVLDEPTSALDPTSAEEVLAALLRLVHDAGITLLIAEHRLERVAEYADTVINVANGSATLTTPGSALADSPLAPPVVRLGRLMGWRPLPLSVREARRESAGLREHLAGLTPSNFPTHDSGPAAAGTGLRADGLRVTYGSNLAVDDVTLTLPGGTVTALMGRNGSGKSSLLWALSGVGSHAGGTWQVGGVALSKAAPAVVRRHIRLVPQTAADLLYLPLVASELDRADKSNGQPGGTCRAILDDILPNVPGQANPLDLSEGQKLAVVLAVQLTGNPPVILLDEPTRGLDQVAKMALGKTLTRLAAAGRAVCVATHDVEFVALVADQVAVLAGGQLIASGAPAEVLSSSVTFSPQVTKVMLPQRWLTVDQVAKALAAPTRGCDA